MPPAEMGHLAPAQSGGGVDLTNRLLLSGALISAWPRIPQTCIVCLPSGEELEC